MYYFACKFNNKDLKLKLKLNINIKLYNIQAITKSVNKANLLSKNIKTIDRKDQFIHYKKIITPKY